MKTASVSKLIERSQLPKVLVLCFLLLMVAIAAVPSYLSGQWSWAHPPKVANLKQLKNLQQQGLTIPGWKTVKQEVEIVGGHKWSTQEIQRDDQKPITLRLFPQKDDKGQPEVEWMDINGVEQWQTDSYRQLQFTAPTSPVAKVESQFFRAWNQQQTYAVMQWYAWSGGGHPAPSQWFFADRSAQRQGNRVPWVAVSLKIPIAPLGTIDGEIEKARPLAISLGETVQAALMAQVLKTDGKSQ
jgi:cyanoexosortase B-associated protein